MKFCPSVTIDVRLQPAEPEAVDWTGEVLLEVEFADDRDELLACEIMEAVDFAVEVPNIPARRGFVGEEEVGSEV